MQITITGEGSARPANVCRLLAAAFKPRTRGEADWSNFRTRTALGEQTSIVLRDGKSGWTKLSDFTYLPIRYIPRILAILVGLL